MSQPNYTEIDQINPSYKSLLLKTVHSKYLGGLNIVSGKSVLRTLSCQIIDILLLVQLIISVFKHRSFNNYPFFEVGVLMIIKNAVILLDSAYLIIKSALELHVLIGILIDLLFWGNWAILFKDRNTDSTKDWLEIIAGARLMYTILYYIYFGCCNFVLTSVLLFLTTIEP